VARWEVEMRAIGRSLLMSGMAWGQGAEPPKPTPKTDVNSSPAPAETVAPNPGPAAPSDPNAITIPAGTKIPLSLAQAISTKNAREGDAVYATTAFPFVVDNRMFIPAGSYFQGKISHVERAGPGHGPPAPLIHSTSFLYTSSYTL